MQTIGLVGGTSWESSSVYYQLLNQGIEQRLGGLHSAKCVLSSVEFSELTALQDEERWDEVAAIMTKAAQGVEAAGADFMVLCTTTFHRVADQVEAAIDIPLLHLGDVVATAVKDQGLSSVALLGTTFAMTRKFFVERLASHDLNVVVPEEKHHDELNRIIYEELVHGRVLDTSRRYVVSLVQDLWDAGAQGVILGCTELELLVKQADSEIPVFPCTTLHVSAALDKALTA
ncbi:MAG TPA: aspartate/glutamate racemase family protein [Nocardioidaceae bacterium]|nr:aspartate/glutamate racemase family protein [Nocardioidaceae bacterium]